MKDGLLIVDKPKNCTSRDIVNIVEKTLNTKKVGHAGTLDPMATGVLVIAVGNALKVLEFLTDGDKEYIAKVKLGILTDTLDTTGNVLKEDYNYKLTKEHLENTLVSFKGKYLQEVPLFSSVRVNGKRLYHYARSGENVELPKREVEIFDIELLDFDSSSFTFRAVVSKGTYIRSLIRDIGEKLKVLCSMNDLRRTRQDAFDLENAVSIEDIKNNRFNFLPIILAFNNYPIIKVDSNLEKKIMNGCILDNIYNEEKLVFVNKDNEVLALYGVCIEDKSKIKTIKTIKSK